MSRGTVYKVLGPDEFDDIEFQAARTGNHVRAAVRMGQLARAAEQGEPYEGISLAEAHLRTGEQWLMADDPVAAAAEFTQAIEDGGPTFADPRVFLARALHAMNKQAEAAELLAELRAERAALSPRTCDLAAEFYCEHADLRTALDWADAGVRRCLDSGDKTELRLLLSLRFRIRNDLGLDEDEYDRMLRLTQGGR